MQLENGSNFKTLQDSRHELNLKLVSDLKTECQNNQRHLKENRASAENSFRNMSEVQSLISDEVKFKSEIEDMHVKL